MGWPNINAWNKKSLPQVQDFVRQQQLSFSTGQTQSELNGDVPIKERPRNVPKDTELIGTISNTAGTIHGLYSWREENGNRLMDTEQEKENARYSLLVNPESAKSVDRDALDRAEEFYAVSIQSPYIAASKGGQYHPNDGIFQYMRNGKLGEGRPYVRLADLGATPPNYAAFKLMLQQKHDVDQARQ